MNFAKRITRVALASVTAMSLCSAQMFSGVQPLIAEAENYSDKAQYGDYLYYEKVDEDEDGTYDYVEIFSCDRTVTEVEIPDEIEGLPVTNIGYNAFYMCISLESITIPDSITSLGQNAFSCCIDLSAVTIPDGVESIGLGAFSNCESLECITIPDSVTSIGENAFIGTPWFEARQAENPLVIVNNILIDGRTCSGDVVIPDGVKSIGDAAFLYCHALESITIPDSVTSIGYDAFSGTALIDNQTGPVYYADNWVIDFYWEMTSAEIKEGTRGIGNRAFLGCDYLESITIPESVTSIGYSAFASCDSLASITIENPECEIYDSEDTISDTATIYGYTNSTAQAYAEKYGYAFESLDEEPTQTTTAVTTAPVVTTTTTAATTPSSDEIDWSKVRYGDVNLDNEVAIADIVFLSKYVISSKLYPLENATAVENADVTHDTEVTSADTQKLIEYIVNAISSLD